MALSVVQYGNSDGDVTISIVLAPSWVQFPSAPSPRTRTVSPCCSSALTRNRRRTLCCDMASVARNVSAKSAAAASRRVQKKERKGGGGVAEKGDREQGGRRKRGVERVARERGGVRTKVEGESDYKSKSSRLYYSLGFGPAFELGLSFWGLWGLYFSGDEVAGEPATGGLSLCLSPW